MTNQSKSNFFPFYKFKGTHKEIGRQYGESCKNLIIKHLDLVCNRLQNKYNVSLVDVKKSALEYQPYVIKYAPFLAEEIQGLAEGADISLSEAYLLQIRAELNHLYQPLNECTTFAISPENTKNNVALIGQNADLPSFYAEIGVVIEMCPDEGPANLIFTPAGQISYIGINNLGMGVFANYINCDGWRKGFPRYMLSRKALSLSSTKDAIRSLQDIYRASSRNLILIDSNKTIVDLEMTPNNMAIIETQKGLLAHSNHFISDQLLSEERSEGTNLENSYIRLNRINNLLEKYKGDLDSEKMKRILCDRGSYPHCICQKHEDESHQSPGGDGKDVITIASVIAEPSEGNLWVAQGPPDEYEYKLYQLS